jgi:hypothetical protein
MQIIGVHMSSPIELRFTIVDGDRDSVRMVFPPKDAAPERIAELVAQNMNYYFADKAAGFPHDYREGEHIAGILADAPRYGCD